jgi:hypothetical protein
LTPDCCFLTFFFASFADCSYRVFLNPFSPLNSLTPPQPLGVAPFCSPHLAAQRLATPPHPLNSLAATTRHPHPPNPCRPPDSLLSAMPKKSASITSAWCWCSPSGAPGARRPGHARHGAFYLIWAVGTPPPLSLPRCTSASNDISSNRDRRWRWRTPPRCSLCSHCRRPSGKPPRAAAASDVPDLLLLETTTSCHRQPHPKLAAAR